MGKNKYIESPEKMWEYFEEYKKTIKDKPILVKDYVGKDGMEVNREKERPLTVEGFECYLYDNGIISDISHYFANLDKRYTEYIAICSRIRKAVRNDQIEGGMAGIYNPSITQRLNGLTEKTDNTHKVELTKKPDWLTDNLETTT
jgi:hypothetical protein